jgi:hypothetical protein
VAQSAKPQILREADALQLASRALRNFCEEQDLLRRLESGDPLRQKCALFLLGRGGALAQHDGGGPMRRRMALQRAASPVR